MSIRNNLLIAGKATVSAVLLAVLLYSVDLHAFWTGLRGADLTMALLAVGAYFAMVAVDALRLHHAMRSDGLTLENAAWLTLYGQFFMNILPGNIGNDAYRFLRLRELVGEMLKPLAVLFLLRLLSLLVVAAGALVSTPLLSDRLAGFVEFDLSSGWVWVTGIGISALLCIGLLPGAQRLALRGFRRAQGTLAFVTLRTLVEAIILTVAMNGIRLVMFIWFFQAAGIDFSWLEALAVMSLAIFATALPVSLGGIGLREGAITAVAVLLGASAEGGAIVAVLARGVLLIGGVCGGIAYLVYVVRGRNDH